MCAPHIVATACSYPANPWSPMHRPGQLPKGVTSVSPARKRILIVVIAVGTSIYACLLSGPLVGEAVSRAMAEALAPPEYPGSVLEGTGESGGPDSRWRTATYYTPDSIDKVMAFMEGQMPGFSQSESQGYRGPVYRNVARNESKLAEFAAFLATGESPPPMLPTALVMVGMRWDAVTSTAIGTTIWIRTDWPAP